MYSCYVHGWHNFHQTCPTCHLVTTTTSSGSGAVIPTIATKSRQYPDKLAQTNTPEYRSQLLNIASYLREGINGVSRGFVEEGLIDLRIASDILNNLMKELNS